MDGKRRDGMRPGRRAGLRAGAGLTACWLAGGGLPPRPAMAQGFPARAVTLVVPFPPGGGVDPIARLLSEKLGKAWGQPVVVSNRPGGGSSIGTGIVARAEPDGYTLLVTANTFAMAPHVLPRNLGYTFDVQRDFTPIAMISSTPMLLLAHPGLGVKNARELAELARSGPPLAYATSGNGSPMHIAGELFNRAAGLSLLHSPYRGVGPALNDALGGQVKLIYLGYGGAKPYIESGRLVPLAVVDERRSPLIPDLPTMAEQGFPGVFVNIWFGVYGPAGMAPALADRLNAQINAALREPDAVEHFRQRGELVAGGPREVLAKATREDYERYGEIVKRFKIQAD
ncbi:Bug family tripartite tricarboxylate transporter substrate binding protein [Pigmentiphaga kullae]|uniref:Tripartite-type tricarboxylate transporter receptor subunit TctC n=1 Tax=Pigmentiphaga kullae TaxID=151784 RepID=A0A4Q7NHI9_9BURK|nr:tripartite tricarboxylate transporter substrate-binding protein [Pigmentiphaga kullae]RZS84451.1 tripartite-type tricarboxylate transporter receptor subunit TctC [Pigmentiphaga kullae]